MTLGRPSARALGEKASGNKIRRASTLCHKIEKLEADDPAHALIEAKRLALEARLVLMGAQPAGRSRTKPHVGLTEQERRHIIFAGR